MAYFASPFYQNLVSLSEHRVPQVLKTTYMDHYIWPFRETKKTTLEDLKPPIILPTTDSHEVEPSSEISQAQPDVQMSVKSKKKQKFDNRNWHQDFAPDDPQWKIEGWRAAENFWRRPLSEREEYVRTFGKIWDVRPGCDIDKKDSLCEESEKTHKSKKKDKAERSCSPIIKMNTKELIEKGYDVKIA